MNKLLILTCLMGISAINIAQPSNDDCSGIIDLGDVPVCPSPAIYTNFGATESDIGNDNQPPCFTANPVRDVWFSFTAVATIEDNLITVTGTDDGMGSTPMSMPQVALYRGDACLFDELVLLNCASSEIGESDVELQVDGLTAGITYYLRINDWTVAADPNWGSFSLCIEEFEQTVFTVDEGGATSCSGELFDSGGAIGNYGNNENHVFTICPDDPHGCILFNLMSYNIHNGNDIITFYDGSSIFGPVVGTIDGGANGQNHGGVCYSVSASSGCLTVQFTSDAFLNFQGFHGTWECTTEDCPEPSPVNISAGVTAQEIETAFENPLLDVTVTNINCPNEAYGIFGATEDTGLGMNDGILLTTGRAEEISNPATFLASTDHFAGGDPDMEYLHATYGNGAGNTSDACVIEMDVTAKMGRVGFDYIFGSDEYKNFFSQFSNDFIGIMVSGPGIPGEPGLNNQENLAFLPVNTLIQIQTINASTRWEYYRNNMNSDVIAYNGLTSDFMGTKKTMTVQKTVTPCETYHVKLAIADTDPEDDSGLFIKPSVEGIPVVSVDFSTGIDYLVEDCIDIDNAINIGFPNPINTTLVFKVDVGGTAIKGTDYTSNLPIQLIFQPGVTDVTFPISVINDGIPEGTETIEIKLTTNFGCGEIVFSETTIEIKDELEVDILPGKDTLFVCDGIFTADLNATGAAVYSWSPPNVFDDPNIQNPTATITTDQTVSVTGQLGNCSASDEVLLQIISPQVEITAAGSTQICEGESLQLTANNNINNAGLNWSPITGLDDPVSANPIATPSFTTTYTVNVETQGGCQASDEITITVEPFDFPELTTKDTFICQNSSVNLGEAIPNSTTIFEWTPSLGLNDPSLPNPTATPDMSTLYTLTATSVNGLCSETATVNIEVFPADVDIQNPDTVEICLGEKAELISVTSTGGLGLTWSPADSLSSTTDEMVFANPLYSTWYVATLEVGDCIVSDSVYVRVDSLPDLTIQAIPDKAMYCEGEIISLASQGYPASAFLGIEHQWIPATGAISEDSLLNLVITATETTTYQRFSSNHACSDTAEIEIIVVPTAEITVSPDNPVVCPGEPVQLTASSDDIDEFEWTPDLGLSCSDCPNPIANPPSTISYQVSGEFMGCPSSAVVMVEVIPPPVYDLISDTQICEGESVVLNNIEDPNATYNWTFDDGTLFSNESMPPATPMETTTYHLAISIGSCPPFMESVTVEVIQEADLELVVDAETICRGEMVNLQALMETQGGTYVWEPEIDNDGSKASDMPSETTTYTVTYTSPLACFSKQASVTVTVIEPFTIDTLIAEPESVFEGEEITLEVLTQPSVLTDPTYFWNENNQLFDETAVNMTTTNAPEVEADSVEYIYQVEIEDGVGCRAIETVTVIIKDSFVELPNAFTPDNDNINDFFNLIRSDNVTVLDFRIWNRWGQLVYDNDDNEIGWGGSYKGKPASVDVYVYQIRYEFAGREEVLRGDVTLLR